MPRNREIVTVPVDPFQDRFLELVAKGVPVSEICRRLGWVKPRPMADISRLKRTLGLQAEKGSKRQRIGYDLAERLCEALDMDPHEGGF